MSKFDYLIIGGGISGLTTAYYISKLLPKRTICVIEKTARFGGQIITETKNGIELEMGPRSFSSKGIMGKVLLDLVVHLGLKDELSQMSKSATKNRYIYTGSRLYLVPTTIGQFIKSNLPYKYDLIRAIMKDLTYKQSHPLEDETAESFLSKRFGRDLTEKFFSAFIRTITGSNLNISMKSNFPAIWNGSGCGKHSMLLPIFRNDYPPVKLHDLVGQLVHNSEDKKFIEKVQYQGQLYRFSYSIHTLTDALGNHLRRSENVKMYRNSCVTKISPKKDDKERVVVEFNDTLSKSTNEVEAGQVIVACSALELSNVIKTTFGNKSNSVSDALHEIKYADLVSVNLAFKNLDLDFDGFGYAVPVSEKTPVYGTMFRDYTSKGDKITILTSICGLPEIREAVKDTDSQSSIIDLVLKEVIKHLNLDTSVEPATANLHKFENVFPRHNYGHCELIRWIKKGIENFYDDKVLLLGWCYQGLSLSSCVLHARNLAIEFYKNEEIDTLTERYCKAFRSEDAEQSEVSPDINKNLKGTDSSNKKVDAIGKVSTKRRKQDTSKMDTVYKPTRYPSDDSIAGDPDYYIPPDDIRSFLDGNFDADGIASQHDPTTFENGNLEYGDEDEYNEFKPDSEPNIQEIIRATESPAEKASIANKLKQKLARRKKDDEPNNHNID